MLKITKVETSKAPQALGPYSQAICVDNFIFCSGQIGINSVDQNSVEGNIEEQTKQAITHMQAILLEAHSCLSQVIKCEVYLKNMNDFASVNKVYATYFCSDPMPARVTVEVAQLPKNALIEISCIAYKK